MSNGSNLSKLPDLHGFNCIFTFETRPNVEQVHVNIYCAEFVINTKKKPVSILKFGEPGVDSMLHIRNWQNGVQQFSEQSRGSNKRCILSHP